MWKGGGEPSKPPRTLVLGPISVYILLLHFLQQACNVSRTLEHFFFFISILTLFFYNKLCFWSDVKPIKKLTPTVKRKKKSTCLKCKRNICGMGKEFFSKLCNPYSCIQQVSMFLLLFPGARSLLRKAPNIATTSRVTPRHIPTRPLRTWPYKCFRNHSILAFPQRKTKCWRLKDCVCVYIACQVKKYLS